MSAGKYWLLFFLSVIIAALIIFEIGCENQVALLTAQVTFNRARVDEAREQGPMLRQLVQRLAAEGQRDPAFAELLTKRGLHVSYGSPNDPALPTAPPTFTPPLK